MTSNLVFTIWAVFGGFVLHFLLSNYLTVLLRPSYEAPVDTAKELVDRNITPFYFPGGQIWRQFFAAFPDENYNKIAERLVIPKDYDELDDLLDKVMDTGSYAQMGTVPYPWLVPEEEHIKWYRSKETVNGTNPYIVHLTNKKWPLKEVLMYMCQTVFISVLSEV